MKQPLLQTQYLFTRSRCLSVLLLLYYSLPCLLLTSFSLKLGLLATPIAALDCTRQLRRHAWLTPANAITQLQFLSLEHGWLLTTRSDHASIHHCLEVKKLFPSCLKLDFHSADTQHRQSLFISSDMLDAQAFHQLFLLGQYASRIR